MDTARKAAAERRRKELLRIEVDAELDRRWADALEELQSRDDVAAAWALVRAGELRIPEPLLVSDAGLRAAHGALAGSGDAEVPLRDVTWHDSATNDAAAFVRDFVDGVVGAAPDAARGRLVLRPRMKAEWPRARFQNIRVQDALIDLLYERAGAVMKFTIVQTAGAYPVRLIFEPVLPVAPRYTFVDGKPASLNTRADGAGVIVPVQIMLDEQRVVGFELP